MVLLDAVVAFAHDSPLKCLSAGSQFQHLRHAWHYSGRTEETYVHWIKRFIFFSGKRHPETLGGEAVTAFLNHLARDRKVAAATQDRALAALLFLYKEVIGKPLPWLVRLERAKRPADGETALRRGVGSPLDRLAQ